MRQHPIWNEVTSCKYNSSKSYGISDTGKVVTNVGRSRVNSYQFLESITTRRFENYKGKNVCVFRYSVDGIVVKIMIFEDNNGKAGKYIKTISKLNSIKSIKI